MSYALPLLSQLCGYGSIQIIFYFSIENLVDGEAFLSLTEADFKEIVPPIGVVKKILKLKK